MQALLLAAGLGTRLKPYTEILAKPAICFLNVPMMGYPLFWLEKAGLKRLVINTHHLPDTIEFAARKIVHPSYSLAFSHEPEILGGGGGLKKAYPLLDQSAPVVLINGDSVVLSHENNILERAYEFHLRHKPIATLVCTEHPDVGVRFGGVFVEAPQPGNGHSWASIKKFSKTPISGLRGLHFIGALIVSPELLPYLPEGSSDILYDVIARALEENKKALAFVDPSLHFFETGDLESYLQATNHCLNLLTETSAQSRFLQAVLSRFTPGWDNFKVEGIYSYARPSPNLLISQGTRGLLGRANQIAGKCTVKDFFVIGEGAKVSAGTHIEASVIHPQAEVFGGENLLKKIFLK